MPKRNLAWILVVALIALLFWRMPQTIAGRDSVYVAFGALVDVRAQIHKRAAEPVDDAVLTSAAGRAGIEAMLRALGDPHALYLDRRTFPEFRKRTEGVFGGIGVDVRMAPKGLEVLGRIGQSPAWHAGIRAGDIIERIDGEKTADLGLVESVSRLNGPPGTEVALFVRRGAGRGREMRLRRAIIEVNPVRGWRRNPDGGWQHLLDAERRIGYVRLVKFMPHAVQALDAAVQPLLIEGLNGLVFDLRENTGGLLRTAIDVADRFLDSGVIVSKRGRRSDTQQWLAQREGTYPPFPVVLLVNGSTASAAEVVAGALRDHRRAVIVGERTYGKGSVQELIPLEDGETAIKLTTAYYYLPSGRCLERRRGQSEGGWGVEPDVHVPLSDEQREAWMRAWYAAGMEPAEEDAQPDSSPNADDSPEARQAAGRVEQRAAALLAADPQLKVALALLQREIDADADRPDEPDEGGTKSNGDRPGD